MRDSRRTEPGVGRSGRYGPRSAAPRRSSLSKPRTRTTGLPAALRRSSLSRPRSRTTGSPGGTRAVEPVGTPGRTPEPSGGTPAVEPVGTPDTDARTSGGTPAVEPVETPDATPGPPAAPRPSSLSRPRRQTPGPPAAPGRSSLSRPRTRRLVPRRHPGGRARRDPEETPGPRRSSLSRPRRRTPEPSAAPRRSSLSRPRGRTPELPAELRRSSLSRPRTRRLNRSTSSVRRSGVNGAVREDGGVSWPWGRTDPTDASVDDNWSGGHYELAIRLGVAPDDDRVAAAAEALWKAAALGEARPRHGGEPIAVNVPTLVTGGVSTVADIPGLGRTLGLVLVIREATHDDSGEPTGYGNDWLDLCLPLGALSELDERVGAYPFEPDTASSRAWRSRSRTGSVRSRGQCGRWFRTNSRSPDTRSPEQHMRGQPRAPGGPEPTAASPTTASAAGNHGGPSGPGRRSSPS